MQQPGDFIFIIDKQKLQKSVDIIKIDVDINIYIVCLLYFILYQLIACNLKILVFLFICFLYWCIAEIFVMLNEIFTHYVWL